MEVQELYNSQLLLAAEMSNKLERTEVSCIYLLFHRINICLIALTHSRLDFLVQLQKKLEETEHSLFDLEEKHRQANATIKEKEFLISNLLKSGKKKHSLLFCYLDIVNFTTENLY